MKKRVCIVGSAHMDILAESDTFGDTIDRPGSIRLHIGGCAYNVAVNLSKLGCDVFFISAFNRSATSKMIITEMEANNITCLPEYIDNLPDSGFSAHNQDGQMINAVSAIAVGSVDLNFSDEMINIMRESDYVFCDCNLRSETISKVIACIHSSNNQNDKKTPVGVHLVSQAKAMQLTWIDPLPDMVFCNSKEYHYLDENDDTWEPPENLDIYITKASKGAILQRGLDVHERVKAKKVDRVINTLGAGDGFAAGVINKFCEDRESPEKELMEAGVDLATKIIQMEHCNLGSHDVINKALNELEDRAYKDELTGLLNRKGAGEVFKKLLSSDEEHVVLFFDIDHFKRVNDEFGHAIGDEAIKFVASCTKDLLRESDYAIRWGGEEYIAIIKANWIIGAKVANRIGSRVAAAQNIGPIKGMTISMGMTRLKPGTDALKAIEYADEALYISKDKGRNKITYVGGPDVKNQSITSRYLDPKEGHNERGFTLQLIHLTNSVNSKNITTKEQSEKVSA